jgi:mevalonate kinase
VPKQLYKANGKLLLFGEYAVMDGAKALAIPTKFGQTLQIKAHRGSDLMWEAYTADKELWFEAQISLYDFSPLRTSDEGIALTLQKLLKGAVRYNCEFLDKWNGFKVISTLGFPREWGLGSSSTLTYLIAEWAEVNAFHLHFQVSNGSGYDIACAGAEGPLTYRLTEEELNYEEIDFEPSFLDKIYFVYLGRKQNSGEAIAHYAKQVKKRKELAAKISDITAAVIKPSISIAEFGQLMNQHEDLLAESLQLPVLRSQFPDLKGHIKSLGAWGGDFAMVLSQEPKEKLAEYFKGKGLNTFMSYSEMAL